MGDTRRLFSFKYFISLGISVFFCFAHTSGWAEEDEMGIPAVIVRVEGEGIAKVKKAIGTEEVAGANGKIFPGDRVITDEKSTVFLMINDGSMIKVGFASEFRVEKAGLHERFMTWAFGLVKGSMRAMVEKNPNPDIRFRVNTPSGTMGVRGTEFVVVADEGSKSSYLYTLEGLVSYGKPGCDSNNSCLDVRAGETAFFKEGDSLPTRPQAFQPKELFGLSASAKSIDVDRRMSLFRDAKKVTARYMQDTDDAALKKLVSEASEALAAAQDRAIGRSQEERVLMHAAIKDGTWSEIIAAADAYAEQNSIFDAGINGGAENILAQTVAAKFRLGRAVMAAAAADIFGNAKVKSKDPVVKWASTDLKKVRKNVGYEKTENAKLMRARLAAEADDYKKVLELAEAQPLKEKQPKAAENASEPEQTSAEKCNRRCRGRRIMQEIYAMSEGVVSAFDGSSVGQSGEEASPGRLTRKENGLVKSKHFRKAIPGNACYNETQDCKLIVCSGVSSGKKCKKGESVKECVAKKTQVRCKDND